MYSAPFEYSRANSVDEAVALLKRHGDGARLIAGGHSLVPLLKLRFAEPAHLIDIRRIAELSGIQETGGSLVIGATTTHDEIANSALVREKLPVLAETASWIGDPAVRNLGTIGGSLAHADPAADLPATILALDAEMHAVGPDGARTVAAADFFVGLLSTALLPGEILTKIRVPLPPAGSGGAYAKFPHPASRYAVIGVAAIVSLGADGKVSGARVALTGLADRPARATAVEQALTGKQPDASAIDEAARHAAEGLTLRADAQGSAAYKANLARVYAARALKTAVQRAAG